MRKACKEAEEKRIELGATIRNNCTIFLVKILKEEKANKNIASMIKIKKIQLPILLNAERFYICFIFDALWLIDVNNLFSTTNFEDLSRF